jgi:thiamine pyrophosphokinase
LESTESVVENVVALNCFGGRLDHTLAILNSAQKFEKSSNLKIQLMNESCLARVIHDNEVIINYSNLQGNNCGLLPLFGPINLETVGLKWDLNSSQKLEFSDLISTSNCVIDSQVVIKSLSNIPFIWTHEITYQ